MLNTIPSDNLDICKSTPFVKIGDCILERFYGSGYGVCDARRKNKAKDCFYIILKIETDMSHYYIVYTFLSQWGEIMEVYHNPGYKFTRL